LDRSSISDRSKGGRRMDKLVSESSAANSDSRFSSRSHSIRLCGSVTSIRLENAFWDVLALMAAEKSVSLNQLIAKIHAEMSGLNEPHHNTASILRVICIEWASEERKYRVSELTGPLSRLVRNISG
jgi:predicted DNA-binding ribbon-helix-helix protein